jgi:site-specific recombinase XerD
MNTATLLGTRIRRFLLEHLVAERNLALNTQRSYRDTLVLLIPFVAKKAGKAVDRLSVVELSAELIRLFLLDLETSRRCANCSNFQPFYLQPPYAFLSYCSPSTITSTSTSRMEEV